MSHSRPPCGGSTAPKPWAARPYRNGLALFRALLLCFANLQADSFRAGVRSRTSERTRLMRVTPDERDARNLNRST